jgi:hypothetical protein
MIVKVGETDQIIKGARRGRAWDELQGVVATLSGQSLGRIEAVA